MTKSIPFGVGFVASVILILIAANTALAQRTGGGDYWNQFRGPRGDGSAVQAKLPAEFGEAKNVRWKTAIHDEGWSSPVVWGNQVWLTAARKEGTELFALCVDLQSGQVIYDIKVFDVQEPQLDYEGYNTHATPTPIVEEDRVYVHFGAYGTACLDTQTGKKLWERRDLKCNHRVRPASSPIIDGDRLFLVYDGADVQFIVALDKKTGATLWRRDQKPGMDPEASLKAAGMTDSKDAATIKPDDTRKAFATPAVIEHQGRRQLISPAAEATYSYDPATGEELWRVRHECATWNSACRPIYEDGLVYVVTGYAKQLLAIRPDGTGDATGTHIAWNARKGVPSVSSPVVVNGLLFMVDDTGGRVSCLDAKTGGAVWSERLPNGRSHWASPLLAGGKIYFFSREGDVEAVAAAREFQVLESHKFDAGFTAGPAVAENALLLRSEPHLYCIAEDSGNATK